MKNITLIVFILLAQGLFAQKYFTRTGITEFKASVETFEPVEAINKSTTVILNTATGNIAGQLFITAFQFDIALMQEHFNENYMDSDQYPKATFSGKLENFSLENLNEEKEFLLKGTLTIREIEKEIEAMAKVYIQNEKIIIKASTTVQPQDFGIKIPNIVREKIAKEINIIIDYELSEKK